jgi:hypothetical protein
MSEITKEQYQNGLANFITIVTQQPIEQSNIDAARTAHFMKVFRDWATIDDKSDENNPYYTVGNLGPYLQFVSNAGYMNFQNKVADFSAALFFLAKDYIKENPNTNLAGDIDTKALERVLPEWVNNFSPGFKFKQKKFILSR